MVPYMSFTWQSFTELLRSYTSPIAVDGQLWLALVQTLSKAMSADEDKGLLDYVLDPTLVLIVASVFWRSDKLRLLAPLAAQQVPVAVRVNLPDGKDALVDFLEALLGILDDDVLTKSLNLDILMHSRSEDARVRLLSITCAEQLWRAHGEKLLGMTLLSSIESQSADFHGRLRGGDCYIHCRGCGRRQRLGRPGGPQAQGSR